MQPPRFVLKIFRLVAIAACLAAVYPPWVFCQALSDEMITEDGKWKVAADQITYDEDSRQYTATGNVVIVQGEKELRADRVVLNRAEKSARAFGRVRLVSGNDRLTGRRLEMDMAEGTGTLYQGEVFIRENNFHIRGDRIEKTGKDTYRIRDGSMTTCQGPRPDWQITGKDVNVTIGGYGTVSHAAFWARRLPVFYVPWFVFPVKLERQSGLLAPQAGYSSRNGAEYIQPFFWAISKSSDATFYFHHLQERGEKFGVEYRYVRSKDSRGILMADGFEDRRIDDGTPEATEKWGYEDEYNNEEVVRPNDGRYWFRMKADQQLPWDAMARLDLDIVSDQDYLREFSDGYMGHEPTADQFVSEFGRDIDDENDPVRTNRLNIRRTWTYQSLNADLVWYDNVIKRRLSDTDDTLQQLPRIRFDSLKQPLFPDAAGRMLFGSLGSEYTYFYRQDGLTGHRVDLHPRFYLPMHAGPYLNFEPSVGLRQTAWYVDAKRQYYGNERDRYKHRELYDIEGDLSTDINRVFSVDGDRIKKIKHVIIPRLAYNYIPDTDQSEYPDFDQTDRIDPQNSLGLSFTHLFTSKYKISGPAEGSDEYQYNRFCRFFIEQAYDFRQRDDPEAALLPLYAELDLTPASPVTLHADAKWSHQIDELASANISGRLRDRRGDRFSVEYRYDRDANKSLYLSLETPVTRQLKLFGHFERNLETETDIEKGIGVRWESQCWAVEIAYLDEETGQSYMAMLELYGLGGIGDTLER